MTEIPGVMTREGVTYFVSGVDHMWFSSSVREFNNWMYHNHHSAPLQVHAAFALLTDTRARVFTMFSAAEVFAGVCVVRESEAILLHLDPSTRTIGSLTYGEVTQDLRFQPTVGIEFRGMNGQVSEVLTYS